MGTTTTLVTVQEFLDMPEAEGERLELIEAKLSACHFRSAA